MNKWFDRASCFLEKHFMCIIIVLSLLLYMFTYLEDCFGPPIRADGVGYYAPIASYCIYGDLSFERLAEEEYGGEMPHGCYVRRNPETGRYVSTYNIGVAVMMLPFFLVAHLLTFVMSSYSQAPGWFHFNYPLSGYSLFYQHAIGLSGLVYGLAGISILRSFLSRQFSLRSATWTITGLLFGTNLWHYITGESVMSHAYSFFLFAAILSTMRCWVLSPDNKRIIFLLGLLCGMTFLVRLLNILFLASLPLLTVNISKGFREIYTFWKKYWKYGLCVCFVAFACMMPQFIIWRQAAGSWIMDPYSFQTGKLNLLQPQIPNVLFSVKKGLMTFFPFLVFVFPGLFVLKRKKPSLAFFVYVFLVVNIWIVSSYFVWSGGGGFGNRYFVESFVVMAIPICAFYDGLSTRFWRRCVLALSFCFVMYSQFWMKLFYIREISYYGLDSAAVFDIVWIRKEYLLHLMKSFF